MLSSASQFAFFQFLLSKVVDEIKFRHWTYSISFCVEFKKVAENTSNNCQSKSEVVLKENFAVKLIFSKKVMLCFILYNIEQWEKPN